MEPVDSPPPLERAHAQVAKSRHADKGLAKAAHRCKQEIRQCRCACGYPAHTLFPVRFSRQTDSNAFADSQKRGLLRGSLSNAQAITPMPRAPQTEESPATGSETYGQILQASALIGGSSVLNIAIGIVRTKAMAVLLGPAGFGLFGVFRSVATLFQCVAGMGINSSGVRQIAHAASSDDSGTEKIARTAAVLRRISILIGLLGTALAAIFSWQISILTFGSYRYAGAILLLSSVVFFQIVSDGQCALIHGMRQIRDLAMVGVLGALLGTLRLWPWTKCEKDGEPGTRGILSRGRESKMEIPG